MNLRPEMSPSDVVNLTRRDFLASTGMGTLALASLLTEKGYALPSADPLAPRAPHFTPRAKNCILIYFEGAPSHIDLYDPKPKLNAMAGQKLPDDMLEKVRFAFIKKKDARLMGSPRKFTKHGQCGTEMSDLLPHIGSIADDICLVRSMNTTQFNHHPGQLMMNCGSPLFGRPTLGSWLTYGLGNESRDLPAYVVLHAGRGSSAGASAQPRQSAGLHRRNAAPRPRRDWRPQPASPQARRRPGNRFAHRRV